MKVFARRFRPVCLYEQLDLWDYKSWGYQIYGTIYFNIMRCLR